MSKKLVARMNAKILGLDSGFGGHGGLTQQDIAGSLGRCKNPISSPLLRVKYAGDQSSIAGLIEAVEFRVLKLAEENSWKSSNPMVFRALAIGACDEFINKKCSRCGGRGVLYNRNKVMRECDKCEGTGNYKPIASERARALEMSTRGFLDRWQDRWETVLVELAIAEGQGSQELSKQLS